MKIVKQLAPYALIKWKGFVYGYLSYRKTAKK